MPPNLPDAPPPDPDAAAPPPDPDAAARWAKLGAEFLDRAPSLVGSARQVAWATELRARAAVRMGQILDVAAADGASLRRAGAAEAARDREAQTARDRTMFAALLSTRGVRPWIESRHDLARVLVNPDPLRARRLHAWEFVVAPASLGGAGYPRQVP